MNKVGYLIIGIISGIVCGSTAVMAKADTSQSNLIYKAGGQKIYVFDDSDNKCYVTDNFNANPGGISCLKRSK